MIANCEATTTATVAIAAQTTIMNPETRQTRHHPEHDHRSMRTGPYIGLHAHKTPTNAAQNTKLDSIFPASPVQAS
jgi:hypothetical protein